MRPRTDPRARHVTGRLQAAAAQADRQRRGIMQAHMALLDDPELIGEARSWIDRGKSAGFAGRRRSGAIAMRCGGSATRAWPTGSTTCMTAAPGAAGLAGEGHAPVPALPERAILIAQEIIAVAADQLDPDRMAGLCPSGRRADLACSHSRRLDGRAGPGGDGPEILAMPTARPGARRRRRLGCAPIPMSKPCARRKASWSAPEGAWRTARRGARNAACRRHAHRGCRQSRLAGRCEDGGGQWRGGCGLLRT